MVPKHRLTVWLILHETTRLKEIGGFKTQRKATDTGKQIQSREGHPDIRTTISKKYSRPILLSQILRSIRHQPIVPRHKLPAMGTHQVRPRKMAHGSRTTALWAEDFSLKYCPLGNPTKSSRVLRFLHNGRNFPEHMFLPHYRTLSIVQCHRPLKHTRCHCKLGKST